VNQEVAEYALKKSRLARLIDGRRVIVMDGQKIFFAG
jgi:hypothetical protein